MANISLGAEVYTWFMRETGKAYDNKLGHMIEMVEKGLDYYSCFSRLKTAPRRRSGRASSASKSGRLRAAAVG